MGRAKDIKVAPIAAKDANRVVRSLHYSGKVVNNSQLHLGVFLDGKCGGAMQFGPPIMKKNMVGLVSGTGWNEFVELNRMAFADWLPRNSESRAIGYAFRWMRDQYPHIKWCVSFADATQCGDGAIYRAAGFVLTQIKRNSELRVNPHTGQPMQHIAAFHKCHEQDWSDWEPLPGYQLRYVYFLDPSARERLTVPIIPFSEIHRRGAGMYRGKPRAGSIDSDAAGCQPAEGGASPTPALSQDRAAHG